MVLFNDKKFACASCIQGHRSSSCSHVDRPLYEIRKKGRPVSQCEKCRERRKFRKLHVKCICNERPEPQMPVPWPAGRKTAPRRIPSVPAFPNGLKDMLLSGAAVTLPGSSVGTPQDSPASSSGRASPSSDGSVPSSSGSPVWRRPPPTEGPVYASWTQSYPDTYLKPKPNSPSLIPTQRSTMTLGSPLPSPLFCTSPMPSPNSPYSQHGSSGSYFSSHPQSSTRSDSWPSDRSTGGFEVSNDRRSLPRISATQELIARSAASIPPPPSGSPYSRSVGRDIGFFSLESKPSSAYPLLPPIKSDGYHRSGGMVHL